MTEHPSVELIRRGYAAFAAGDVATMTELIADNVTSPPPAAAGSRRRSA